MISALIALPSHVRRKLAGALESGSLAPPFTPASLRSMAGVADEAVLNALQEWRRLGVSGRAGAAWLRSLEEAASGVVPASLVWTGPEAKGLHSRDTRQVYEEMIGSAKRSILISSYAYFDGKKAFQLLAKRMDSSPELRASLLLNIERGQQSTTKSEDLVRRFADRFWKSDWPGKARPSVYYDPRSLELDGPKGVLHAKAVITDEDALFITSANLTEAALDRNIEAGVLLRDRTIVLTALAHFRGLIDQKLLLPLP
ncbi:MAG: phospholipase [Acidobacteriia bacterium]|nr:phospholipase [Terriglobia bacterium]MYG01891.1 phospholipase [Terriglobia bacterium]